MTDDGSDYDPRGCNFCFTDRYTDIVEDRDDVRYEAPRRPLAVAARCDPLQDVEGRKVLITPTRRRPTLNGSHSPGSYSSGSHSPGGRRIRISNGSAPELPR